MSARAESCRRLCSAPSERLRGRRDRERSATLKCRAPYQLLRHRESRPPSHSAADQNPQWWREAKSPMTIGCGASSDSTLEPSSPPNEGQRMLDSSPGLPVDAKLAQAARMLAARVCWSGLNGIWTGASLRSKMYGSSEVCVAAAIGGGWGNGGKYRAGALSSSNS